MTPALGELRHLETAESILLARPRLLVGSHRLCDVIVHASRVAPVQCQLIARLDDEDEAHWFVQNLSDEYPVKVNALPVAEERLSPGDILWLCRTHKYELHYDPRELAASLGRQGNGP